MLIISSCSSSLTQGKIVSFNINNNHKKEINYRVIKIDSDASNYYYLAIKIPENYIQVTYARTSGKDGSIINEFSFEPTHSYNQWNRTFLISKDPSKKAGVNEYFMYRDKYIVRKFKPFKRTVTNDKYLESFDSITAQYIAPCFPRKGTPCILSQEEFSALRIYKGKNFFWTAEHLVKLPHYLSSKEKTELLKKSAQNIDKCCTLFSIQIKSITEETTEKQLVMNKLLNT
jgi:hypothetical protein